MISEGVAKNTLWFAGFLFGLIFVVEVIIKNIPKDSTFSKSNGNSAVKIPRPMELFEFSCDGNRVCTQTAKTYVVYVDGIGIVPEDEFVAGCLRDKQTHYYCRYMFHMGDTKTINFDSEQEMRSIIKMVSKNLEYDSNARNFFGKDRYERAKAKLSL